jgi:transposase
MFVSRAWLASELETGKSFEQIGREIGRDGSTIAWHAKKYGLRSAGAQRFAPRGEPDRGLVEKLAAEGATLDEMARALDRSIATVRYWLDRWSIERAPRAGRKPIDLASAPKDVVMECKHHGSTSFRLVGGRYRCIRCRSARVSEWRRRLKRTLVAEAGGRCQACGYDACPAALQFHHLDPTTKSFVISRQGVARNIAEARTEAQKCVLLCANCHAEVEVGHRILDTSNRDLQAPRGGFEPP